jgi:hypothetical protein
MCDVLSLQAVSQLISNPLAQVSFAAGPIAPTTVAAALSAASFSGATAVTSGKPFTFMIMSVAYTFISSDFEYTQSGCSNAESHSSTCRDWLPGNAFGVSC